MERQGESENLVKSQTERNEIWIVILHHVVVNLTIFAFIAVTVVRIGSIMHVPSFFSFLLAGLIFNKVEKKLDARLKEADDIIIMRELL